MFKATLKKMKTEMANPIQYYLETENGFLHVNSCLDKQLILQHTGYQCLQCSLERPIFRQGFCQRCFFDSPAAGEWIMRPELSKAHLGQADRDLAYESEVQLQPHILYLAMSSHLKVGVTRKSQLPTRWIDQGAHQAMSLIEVPNRYLAGVGEVALKAHFSDKTNWRKMLQMPTENINWEEERNRALDFLPNDLKPYIIRDAPNWVTLDFPVHQYPEKVNSLNLEKTPYFEGKLVGIKGQYWVFEDHTVFNIRGNEGQKISLTIS